jgi:hypothetical protein
MSISSETLVVVINFSDKKPTPETFNKLLGDLAEINTSSTNLRRRV